MAGQVSPDLILSGAESMFNPECYGAGSGGALAVSTTGVIVWAWVILRAWHRIAEL